MNYSQTQLGNLIGLVSTIILLFGGKPFSPEETNSLIVVIGLVGNVVGQIVSWFGRKKKGDLTPLGFRKQS